LTHSTLYYYRKVTFAAKMLNLHTVFQGGLNLAAENGSFIQVSGLPQAADLVHPFWLFQWDLIFQPEVAICSVILFFSAILCSAAGIGGGGIYVAVLMVSGKLTPHDAVPLSKAVVFFGSMASLAVNLYQQAMNHQKPGGKKSD
jgi:hypothetical protein